MDYALTHEQCGKLIADKHFVRLHQVDKLFLLISGGQITSIICIFTARTLKKKKGVRVCLRTKRMLKRWQSNGLIYVAQKYNDASTPFNIGINQMLLEIGNFIKS